MGTFPKQGMSRLVSDEAKSFPGLYVKAKVKTGVKSSNRTTKGLRKVGAKDKRRRKRAVIRNHGLICFHCGCELTYDTLTLDHIVPVVFGGSNAIANMVPACGPCNHRRGHKTIEEFAIVLDGSTSH